MLFASKKLKNKSLVSKIKSTITWWKIGVGIVFLVIGFVSGAVYMGDIKNMVAAFGLIIGLSSGGAFIYWSFNRQAPGYILANQRITGKENAIVHFAKRNGTGKEIPICTRFVYLTNPPKGARLHHVLNLKQHYYELKTGMVNKIDNNGNLVVGHGLVPVLLPDKKPFPPSKFAIAATMQQYKDAIEYVPPSIIQKIGPIAIVIAMAVVGLLIIVTTGGNVPA